jgi:predicted Zn-dependent protease
MASVFLRPYSFRRKRSKSFTTLRAAPDAALAYSGLARAYSLQGDTLKARGAYQDFLTLWQDADPGVPILIAAKAEYAKLK